ncbi:MAG: pre-peptidase C-terminal domain-containing protein [Planctomycetota bacterium]|nr:pre-peptidase C-terminal domain-containing protein [Planctomycetota bacterium]
MLPQSYRIMTARVFVSVLVLYGCLLPIGAQEKVLVPDYNDCRLVSIFPAGGQVGQTVAVQFFGVEAGLRDAKEIVIDGPPGISVRDIKNISDAVVEATFEIDSDAPLGRRCMRVLNARSGLTNMMYFVVGRHPEVQETEPNNDAAAAFAVTLPVIVNAHLNPAADVDFYRFSAKAGQNIVAAVLGQAIDSHGQGRDYGFVDADLFILDAKGNILAEAQDTLGLDPLIEFQVPADGEYTVQVQHVLYRGYPQAVYRLSLGEFPLVTSLFPPGGQRGTNTRVEWNGPNVPSGTVQTIAVPTDDPMEYQYLTLDGDHEVPFVRGELPESIEHEPNDDLASAESIEIATTVNARFDRPGDSDWFKVHLVPGKPILFETLAHRHLRSPVDTRIAIYDADGKMLAENDDGFTIDYMSVYDYQPPDSRLTFTPTVEGDYFVHVTEQTGSGGARSVYRLSVSIAEPDFQLDLYPDAVPIWGPGTTAALVVRVERLNGHADDIELSVEGLPDGWTGSTAISNWQTEGRPSSNFYRFYGARVFLTITAPTDAAVGTHVPFRVVGRSTVEGKAIERIARPTTLYYTSDIGLFRLTPMAHAVVADPQGPWFSTSPDEVTAQVGTTIEIPVAVENLGSEDSLNVVVNLASQGVACSLCPPQMLPVKDGIVTVPVKLPDELPVGVFGITIARTWRSDIRTGMPGPCTRLIPLRVTPKE